MKALSIVAALALFATATAADAAGLTLGKPGYGGTGCPAGTASVVLSKDGKTLSLLFDQYVAEAGAGRAFDRKSCNLAIPVNVSKGISVSVLAIDYRGYNNIPAGASSQFDVEYFFAGSSGPKFTKKFSGPLEDDYLISNKLTSTSWSACGTDVILRANSAIKVTTKAGKQALATVDSEDIKAAVVFKLQWKSC